MKPRNPNIYTAGDGLYEVIGASGASAGWLQRIPVRRGWHLAMKSSLNEVYLKFKDAKAEAIKQGERY